MVASLLTRLRHACLTRSATGAPCSRGASGRDCVQRGRSDRRAAGRMAALALGARLRLARSASAVDGGGGGAGSAGACLLSHLVAERADARRRTARLYRRPDPDLDRSFDFLESAPGGVHRHLSGRGGLHPGVVVVGAAALQAGQGPAQQQGERRQEHLWPVAVA